MKRILLFTAFHKANETDGCRINILKVQNSIVAYFWCWWTNHQHAPLFKTKFSLDFTFFETEWKLGIATVVLRW